MLLPKLKEFGKPGLNCEQTQYTALERSRYNKWNEIDLGEGSAGWHLSLTLIGRYDGESDPGYKSMLFSHQRLMEYYINNKVMYTEHIWHSKCWARCYIYNEKSGNMNAYYYWTEKHSVVCTSF